MKTNDVFPSKYLKAEDDAFDDGAEVTVTIKEVVAETLSSRDKGDETKPVMYFRELPKGLILNKTNWGACVKMFGSDESDDWNGERVTLTTVDVDAFGDVVRAIRIKNQKPKADRAALTARFQQLYEKARGLGIEGLENYVISPNMTDNEVIELGKELKAKVEAAQAF